MGGGFLTPITRRPSFLPDEDDAGRPYGYPSDEPDNDLPRTLEGTPGMGADASAPLTPVTAEPELAASRPRVVNPQYDAPLQPAGADETGTDRPRFVDTHKQAEYEVGPYHRSKLSRIGDALMGISAGWRGDFGTVAELARAPRQEYDRRVALREQQDRQRAQDINDAANDKARREYLAAQAAKYNAEASRTPNREFEVVNGRIVYKDDPEHPVEVPGLEKPEVPQSWTLSPSDQGLVWGNPKTREVTPAVIGTPAGAQTATATQLSPEEFDAKARAAGIQPGTPEYERGKAVNATLPPKGAGPAAGTPLRPYQAPKEPKEPRAPNEVDVKAWLATPEGQKAQSDAELNALDAGMRALGYGGAHEFQARIAEARKKFDSDTIAALQKVASEAKEQALQVAQQQAAEAVKRASGVQ